MNTKTANARHLHGSTTLFNANTGLVLRGRISIHINDERAEVRLENDITGIAESVCFVSDEQREVLTRLVDAIQDVHTDVDVRVPEPA